MQDMIAKATKVNELAKTINNFKEPTFDWDDWSAKFESLGDPNYVPAFKQYVEKTMQAVKEASMKQVEEEVAKGHAELKAIFEGPDGEVRTGCCLTDASAGLAWHTISSRASPRARGASMSASCTCFAPSANFHHCVSK
eukprot:3859614-Pleurochrysis_carterae.AAC.6